MVQKLRMDFTMKCKNNNIEHKLSLYGRSIGFSRIIDNLLNFRDLISSYYNDIPHLKDIKTFEERDFSESEYVSKNSFYKSDDSNNKKFVASLVLQKIGLSTFYNSLERFLRISDNKRDLINKILHDIDKKYSYKEWNGEIPLKGALDILFNKYQEHLRN